MAKTYQVAIADADPNALKALHELLIRLGHRIVAEADSLTGLIEMSIANKSEVVICDFEPDGALCTYNAAISRLQDIPVIIASSVSDVVLLENKVAHQVFGVLLKPLREAELAVMIVVAVQRFQEFSQQRDEASSLRAALEDRKVIEQAKGVVMKKCGFDEASAFRHLQHLARQHRQKVVDIAKGILIAETAFVITASDAKTSQCTTPNTVS
jgi:two-component system, response regulator PdtaR